MSEAEKLCDRIGIVHGGKLLADSTLAELREATGLRYLEDIFVRYVEEHGKGGGERQAER
jgi:sodium transport system ATP-binding protein